MGVLPVNPAGPAPDRLPPRPDTEAEALREKLRDEYASGLDMVLSERQERELERREQPL